MRREKCLVEIGAQKRSFIFQQGSNSAEQQEKARDFEKSDLGGEAHHGHQHGNLAPTEGKLREKTAATCKKRDEGNRDHYYLRCVLMRTEIYPRTVI